jgi:SAM-dependent methyltransferase
MSWRRRATCRVCDGGGLETFLSLGPQPLANAFLRTPADLAAERKFPLDVAFCLRCALVQTPDVIDPELLFRDYVYRSGFSSLMAGHFRGYARGLAEELRLGRDDLVVEVASNDGTLLKQFQACGVRTLGVEPARNLAAEARAAGVETVEEFFGRETGAKLRRERGPARAVVANNVLAHVDDTVDFLRGARELLADGGRLVVESPYLGELLDGLEYDTIYHEHLCYLSVAPLLHACKAAGLDVVRVDFTPVHGGSLRLHATPATGRGHSEAALALVEQERARGLLDPARYRRFAQDVAAHREALVGLLRQLRSEGKRIAAYGAPAKGNTLLNWCAIGPELVEFTVDRNPGKVGTMTPGMHLPVRPVAELAKAKPDVVLVLPWNLVDEIVAQQAELARGGTRFLVPIPAPRLVGGKETR